MEWTEEDRAEWRDFAENGDPWSPRRMHEREAELVQLCEMLDAERR